MNVETVADVDLPINATCYCPLKAATAFMRGCPECQHYLGLVEWDESDRFDQRYRLICAAPIPRQITVIED